MTLGKLVLVDLAGSERASKAGTASKTGTAGMQLAEGALINKSLSECMPSAGVETLCLPHS